MNKTNKTIYFRWYPREANLTKHFSNNSQFNIEAVKCFVRLASRGYHLLESTVFDSNAATLKFPLLSMILEQKPHLSALSRPLVLFTHKFFIRAPYTRFFLPMHTHRLNFWVNTRFEKI